MSLDATIWAWKADVDSSMERLVLLALADRAGEEHTCYPSQKRLAKDTKANIKTIAKVLEELEEKSLIKWTGQIKGNGVKVYQLIGVMGREDDPPTNTKIGTGSKIGTCTKIGVGTLPNLGGSTPPNSGVQNLSKNLPEESKNKNHWLCSKKLSLELAQANPEINPNDILNASWFSREFRAFELFNAGNNLCDELMIYHFANRLLEAKARYDGMKQPRSYSTKGKSESNPSSLTDKQIKFLAGKLSRLHDFSKYAVGNESHEQLAQRLEPMLRDPKNLKKWAPYLIEIGFENKGNAA